MYTIQIDSLRIDLNTDISKDIVKNYICHAFKFKQSLSDIEIADSFLFEHGFNYLEITQILPFWEAKIKNNNWWEEAFAIKQMKTI